MNDLHASNRRIRLRYALRSGTRDTATATQVLGVLFLSGAFLAVTSVVLPHPSRVDTKAIVTIAVVATIVGIASLIWLNHARRWMVHVALALGTGLIALCVYFGGMGTGVYSPMFVWVVLLAASFFRRRYVALHVSWIIISWGIALALISGRAGSGAINRWALGSFVLTVTAVVMVEIVSGRRLTDEQLRSAVHRANHDPLTGLANRRLFDLTLGRELARAGRHDLTLAVIALDLDKFKQYNDEHGHAAGDQLLRDASAVWDNSLRAEDLIARVGGDEFVVLLAETTPEGAERLARRLQGGLPPGCFCSFGTAIWDGKEPAESLLARADEALYQAKNRPSAAQSSLGHN